MITWIDIEDAYENKFGDGPLTAILSSSFGEALSEAAQFSFVVLASDPRIGLIDYERIAKRYIIKNGITYEQSGIIKSISLTLADGNSAYEISGLNLLYELSYSLIQVELFEYQEEAPFVVYHNKFDEYWVKGACADGNPSTFDQIKVARLNEDLYICCKKPFNKIAFNIKKGNENETTYNWHYRVSGSWSSLVGLIDTTEDQGKPLKGSGYIEFDARPQWKNDMIFDGALPYNCYVVRFDPDWASVTIEIREVTVRVKAATTNDLRPILQDSGWILIGHQNTGGLSRALLWDLTRLEALVKMANYRGHAFRLAPGRCIEWLRPEDIGADCGVTILAASSGQVMHASSEDICYVKTARRLIESYDVITAIRAYGGGIGADRVAPIGATWQPPAGYHYDADQNLIVSIQAENFLGRRIEKVVQFGQIASGIDLLGNRDTSDSANEVLQAGVSWLKNHDKGHRVFDIEVIGLNKLLKVGQKIQVNYYDVSQSIFIDDFLFIMAINIIMDQAGSITHKLIVSSVPYWPQENNDFLAETRDMLQELLGHEQGIQTNINVLPK